MPNLLRYEGQTQEEARRKIRADLGGDAKIVRAGKERSGGLLGFFQREVFVFEVEDTRAAPDSHAPAIAFPVGALPPLLEAALDNSASMLTLRGTEASPTFANSFHDVLLEAEATIAAISEPMESGFAQVRADATTPSFDDPTGALDGTGCYEQPTAVPFDSAPEPEDLGPSVAAPPPGQPPSGGGSPRALLAELGMRMELLPAREKFELAELIDSLSVLQRAPGIPGDSGSLVLVAGRKAPSERLARSMSNAISSEGRAFVTYTLPPITQQSGASSARQSGRPRRSEQPGPLKLAELIAARRIDGLPTVLSIATTERTEAMLSDLVAALRPDALWAAIPANATQRDLDLLVERTNGRLDAISLYDFSKAKVPARLLGAGVPVAMIDWHRASPLMISALLFEHIDRRLP